MAATNLLRLSLNLSSGYIAYTYSGSVVVAILVATTDRVLANVVRKVFGIK